MYQLYWLPMDKGSEVHILWQTKFDYHDLTSSVGNENFLPIFDIEATKFVLVIEPNNHTYVMIPLLIHSLCILFRPEPLLNWRGWGNALNLASVIEIYYAHIQAVITNRPSKLWSYLRYKASY